jgi:hypothetical protein
MVLPRAFAPEECAELHLYRDPRGIEPPEIVHFPPANQYLEMVNHFCHCIRQGELLPPRKTGLANMRCWKSPGIVGGGLQSERSSRGGWCFSSAEESAHTPAPAAANRNAGTRVFSQSSSAPATKGPRACPIPIKSVTNPSAAGARRGPIRSPQAEAIMAGMLQAVTQRPRRKSGALLRRAEAQTKDTPHVTELTKQRETLPAIGDHPQRKPKSWRSPTTRQRYRPLLGIVQFDCRYLAKNVHR